MEDLDSIDLLNQNMVQELIDVLAEDALEIFNVFIDELPLLVTQLLDKNSNKEQLLLASHSLKSSAAYVGAERLSTLSSKIEEYLRNNELEKAQSLISNITEIVDQTLIQLKNIINEMKA